MAHRLSPQAELDLDEIWYYIATRAFIILYQVENDHVEILHVARGDRDLPALLNR